MRATLIFNANARGVDAAAAEALLDTMRDVGLEPRHTPTPDPSMLAEALRAPGDVVVVAGGDGTVRAVAEHLRRETSKPMIVLPMGTANNVARSLNLHEYPTEELLAAAHDPLSRRLDVGIATGHWGQAWFLEAFGAGFLADAFATYDPEAGKSPWRAALSVWQTAQAKPVWTFDLTVDGRPVRGQFTALEIMNTPCAGPRLCFAPKADAADGLLDLVLVRADDVPALLQAIVRLFDGGAWDSPLFETYRGRRFVIRGSLGVVHCDDLVIGAAAGEGTAPSGSAITVEVDPGALEIWLPSHAPGAAAER